MSSLFRLIFIYRLDKFALLYILKVRTFIKTRVHLESNKSLGLKMSKMYSTANLSDKELKEQGNRLFSLHKYEDAANCYTKAIVSIDINL